MNRAWHVVSVMRPTTAEGTRGEIRGNDQTLLKNVPASVVTLSGRELVQARTVFAEATYEVKLYGDPKHPIQATDYLMFQGKKLAIAFSNDANQNGIRYTLLCGERVE